MEYTEECIALAEIIHTLSWRQKCGLIEVIGSLTEETADNAELLSSDQQ